MSRLATLLALAAFSLIGLIPYALAEAIHHAGLNPFDRAAVAAPALPLPATDGLGRDSRS